MMAMIVYFDEKREKNEFSTSHRSFCNEQRSRSMGPDAFRRVNRCGNGDATRQYKYSSGSAALIKKYIVSYIWNCVERKLSYSRNKNIPPFDP